LWDLIFGPLAQSLLHTAASAISNTDAGRQRESRRCIEQYHIVEQRPAGEGGEIDERAVVPGGSAAQLRLFEWT
jgi:hypothetical protein